MKTRLRMIAREMGIETALIVEQPTNPLATEQRRGQERGEEAPEAAPNPSLMRNLVTSMRRELLNLDCKTYVRI